MGFFSRKRDKPPIPSPSQQPKPQVSSETLAEAVQRLQTARGGETKTTYIQLEQFSGTATVPKTSSQLLDKLKAQVAKMRVIEHGSTLNINPNGSYHPLPERILGASIVKTNAAVFLVGRTRSTWFVVYDTPHETLHDRNHMLMQADLKMRDKARMPNGKMMYVSSIRTSDLNVLNTIAVMDARKKEAAAPDTLALSEGSAFDFKGTVAKLQKCRVGYSTDFLFDVVVFTAGIQFMTPVQGNTGYYYYMDAGKRDDPKQCELHVGVDPDHPEGSYRHKSTLYYGNEPCFLYIDVNY